jgi:antitoxin YefM
MDSISVNPFRDNLKTYVEQTVNEHKPIKVTRRADEDFIVMSADDWEREQEILQILLNRLAIMKVIKAINRQKSN